jgi:hypothetical protein
MLMGRTRLLNAYYTDTNLFYQGTGTSMIRIGRDEHEGSASMPVCDKVNASETFANAMKTYDPLLIKYIEQSSIQEMVSVSTRRMKNAKTIRQAEEMRLDLLVELCNANKTRFCIMTEQEQKTAHRDDCRLIGGRTENSTVADTATQTFLDSMSRANLNGVIIWGLTPDVTHTHGYIHKAIHKAITAAFEFSSTPMHLCYVRESPSFDLGRDFFNDATLGRLAHSLVFASPKHMTWSNDPGFLMLPLDSTARYVFHSETPRPHTVLKSAGVAIEHEACGPGESI